MVDLFPVPTPSRLSKCEDDDTPVRGCDGRLEAILDGRVHGWAYDPSKPGVRLLIRVVVDGELVGETVADQMRPTLAKAGVGDGRHGFLVELPAHLCGEGTHTISILGPAGRSLPVVSAFEVLASSAAREWARTRFLAEDDNMHPSVDLTRSPTGQAPLSSSTSGDFTICPQKVYLRPSRQINYPRRFLQDGFTSETAAETIALGDHVMVRRPDPMCLEIQPAVRDPDEERSSRVALQSEYLADRPVVTRLPGAIVDTDCFVICPTEHQYLFDSVRHHKGLARLGYSTLDDWVLERDVRPIAECQERVVVLGAQTNGNYSHWLLESVVRALLFRPLDDGSWLYLTPPLNDWQRETLEFIGIGQERILEQGRSGLIRFAEVVAVSRAMMNIYTFIPSALGALSALADPGRARRRIYSSREHAHRRHISNGAEIRDVLARYDFEVVHPESLSIADQVRLFASAETVLGVHGSGLTNTIFSPPGTTVIELQPEGLIYGENAVVRTLAAIRRQPFIQIVCQLVPGMNNLPLQHRDLVVDPRHLDELLQEMFSK
jgi:hypothetical protein